MGFVLRRSLPSITGLVALLVAVGALATPYLGAPLWFAPVFALVLIGLQFALNPFLIQWLVPAVVIAHDGSRYLTDHPVGELVARRCRDAGVPLVKLGIVDDGMPNAFTFGHVPGDARMWITRGLLERLDERELDAVVTHEVGHVKHWDFAVMTVAAAVPMMLYLVYVMTRRMDKQGKAVAIGAYVAYVISQFIVLALSRAREYAADHWSCQCTADGDALASALVKIAYGMGQVHQEEKERAAHLLEQGKEGRKVLAREQQSRGRVQALRAMGIFEPREADAMAAALAGGIDADRALAAMRWDAANPWGATLEKLSTHPLVARRIAALERSGLPGAPRQWSVLRSLAQVSPGERMALRARWAKELFVAVAPWVVLVGMVGFGAATGSAMSVGLALVVAGVLLVVKQQLRYPMRFEPVEEITSLLERLEASPVSGIGVEVRGRVMGRGMPGYVLSPDVVIQDGSGFVPLFYNQPIPFARAFFGLTRVQELLGRDVVARGWYHRSPQPVIELRELVPEGARRARVWAWAARYAASALVLVAGLVVLAASVGR
ncbi:MAG TPA: M48 family metalloprotease [Acidimicrobiales bacterium]|nr:M48 family metalloprotease [Acidimicrobiales bacterium]